MFKKSRVLGVLGIALAIALMSTLASANVGGASPRFGANSGDDTIGNVGGAGPRSGASPQQENVGGASPRDNRDKRDKNVGGAGPHVGQELQAGNVGGAGPRTLTDWLLSLLPIS